MSSVPTPQGSDPDALVRKWTPGAEAGDAGAMSVLSTAYAMKQDWEAAELWARRVLDSDLSTAGMLLLAGIQEQRGDEAGAQEWKRRAEEAQSRMPAGPDFARLAAPIVDRFGSETDVEQMRAAALPAAQAGDVVAMNALGMLLMENDPQQAVRWLMPGAEAGDTLSMVFLFYTLHTQGDEEGAGRWLERAAEVNGESTLMEYCGELAARTGDDEKARYWKGRARQAMAEGDETGPDA